MLFNELRDAGKIRWLTVLGGALLMFAGATLLAFASSAQSPAEHPLRGILAALGAGVLWGTMYVPYRKAYLTGMNPLSFIAFFTIGELGMMLTLAVAYGGGPDALLHQLELAKPVLFWLMLGGFVWVIGDLFQQYAAKYIGISRGIPLSNTNQLWGLLWGILVFGELRGLSSSLYAQVIGGSLLMAAGAGAIALSSVSGKEHARWKQAADREGQRYKVDADYVEAGLSGNDAEILERFNRPARTSAFPDMARLSPGHRRHHNLHHASRSRPRPKHGPQLARPARTCRRHANFPVSLRPRSLAHHPLQLTLAL